MSDIFEPPAFYLLVGLAGVLFLWLLAKNRRSAGMFVLWLPVIAAMIAGIWLFIYNGILSLLLFLRLVGVGGAGESDGLSLGQMAGRCIVLWAVFVVGFYLADYYLNFIQNLFGSGGNAGSSLPPLKRPPELPDALDPMWQELEPEEDPRPARGRNWDDRR